MDNEDILDTGTRVIKCPLKSLVNDRNDIAKVNDYVVVANAASAHTYGLARWIFVHELATQKQFDPSMYLEKRFFGEVFLHLTKRKARLNVKAEIQEYKRVICKHLDAYKEAAGITRFDIANPNQTAQFEAARIYTAYVNNIQTKFGQYLRRAVNALLKTREHKRDLEEAMKDRTTNEIKEVYEDRIWKPGLELKEAIKHRNAVLPVITVGGKNIGDMLEPVLTAYDNDYKFEEEGIYYDIKAHPKKHFKAFCYLAVLLETNNHRSFQCFPLRKSFVPMHIEIDTMTDGVAASVIKKTPKAKEKSSWKAKKRDVEENTSIEASGSGQMAPAENTATGSLPEDQPKKPKKPRKREKPGEEKSGEFTYTHELLPEQLANMENPIFMDPGRQDIVFGMTDGSTSEEKALFRYTRSQKAKETRTTHYRKLREKVKKEHPDSNEIKAAEAILAAFSCTSTCPNCLTGTLETFLKVPNPRPYQREKMKEVLCHGLLKCTNELCMGPVEVDGVLNPRSRMYSRDLAAVLNFRHIFHGLRDYGETPERFCRSQPAAVATTDEQQPKKKRKMTAAKKTARTNK
ncbi:hypothetical protein EV178_004066 [Coemansia sp. RSA 1646]|nr:hypothetical protein EV178_004066 [Coemansia sp. RSA 1646]